MKKEVIYNCLGGLNLISETVLNIYFLLKQEIHAGLTNIKMVLQSTYHKSMSKLFRTALTMNIAEHI